MKRSIAALLRCTGNFRLLCLVVISLALSLSRGEGLAQQPRWTAQAPGPNTEGQVENIHDGEVVGAMNAIAVHPIDANVMYVGSVNGGIWKTRNAMASSPSWEPQTDDKDSLSVGALEFDPMDPTYQTIVAGIGRFSSLSRRGGQRCGLLQTTDGGKTWTTLNGGGKLSGLNISGVAPRRDTIVISVNDADNPADVGVWRTAGHGWTQISGADGSGLPKGLSFGLANDSSNPKRLFTNGGTSGLYRSIESGAKWAKVSNKAMDDVIANAENMKIFVGIQDNVYVAIVVSGDLGGIFHSSDGGENWTSMDRPRNADGGLLPGGQGGIHLSLAADRSNPNLVYIGGDRQEGAFTGDRSVANSINARDYSGRLFRGDTSKPSGGQWVHLTHSNLLGSPGGGTKTCSAPHADSRNMAVAANGDLIEVDDGGIYRRSSPQTNMGDWFSMNGNIQVTELHAVAWDENLHIVIGGAQDTGTPEQRLRSDVRWRSVSTSDGGVVAVDALSTAGLSTRYSSCFNLIGLVRRVYDANNVVQSEDTLGLTPVGTSPPLKPQFYTPIKLNAVAPTRIVFGAENGVFESLDQGDTVRLIGGGIIANDTGTNPIAYGAKANPDVLYVGSGARVYVRTAASPAALRRSATYPGGEVVGIVVDPNNADHAYSADIRNVYKTPDAGRNWTGLTGNLSAMNPGELHSITFINDTQEGSIAVGADTGVFVSKGSRSAIWSRLGIGLPNVAVLSLEYNARDKILLAGTQGRGAWTLSLPVVSADLPSPSDTEHDSVKVVKVGAPAIAAPALQTPGPPRSLQFDKPRTFQLSPRVIVDLEQNHAYAMNPQRGIDAIDLRNGKIIWRTKAGSKPLGIVHGQLIAQAESADGDSRLKIAAIDPATGQQLVEGKMELPPGVTPSVTASMKGEFVSSATAEQDGAVVSWQFEARPKQGLPPGTADALAPKRTSLPPPGVKASVEVNDHGAFRLNLNTGSTSAVDDSKFHALVGPPGSTSSKDDQLTGIEGDQFISADGRHVLVSRRTGDDKTRNKYMLTVYDRTSAERLGEVKSHAPAPQFFVIDSQFISETQPYFWRVGSELKQEPAELRAADLKTGEQQWNHEIRDTSYRGPVPP